jgi:hypothetical protein
MSREEPTPRPAPEPRGISFQEVVGLEISQIIRRRAAVAPPVRPGEEAGVRRTLVGLALSGGGVRSAAFNLGLLQAFFRGGLLRHVDLLSTVSGGGYTGTWLSALLHASAGPLAPDNPDLCRELAPTPYDKQPRRVAHFVRHGRYLYHPLSFANRYLIGLLLNSLTLLSGLIFLCAGAAFLWRLPDLVPVAETLFWLTHGWGAWGVREWNRPLLPAAFAGLLWLAAWGLSGLRSPARPRGRGARYLLWVAGLFLFVGLAVLLATPAISIDNPRLPDQQTNQLLLDETYSRAQVLIGSSVVGLVLTGLLPFLKPQKLLESGLRPTTWYQPWVFRFACTAVLCGVPFLLIVCFARHDFSGQGTENRVYLSDTDVHFLRWRAFWLKVRDEGKASEKPTACGRRIQAPVQWVRGKQTVCASPGAFVWRELDPDLRAEIDHYPDVDLQGNDTDEHARLLKAVMAAPVPLTGEAREHKQRLLTRLNRAIASPLFTATFPQVRDPGWLEKDTLHHQERDRILRLVRKAQLNQLEDGSSVDQRTQETAELNRLLLEVYYPEDVWRRVIIRRTTCVPAFKPTDAELVGASAARLVERDQACRLWWLGGSLAVYLLSGLLVNLNATSLHGYYQDQLARAFLPSRRGKGNPHLAELNTTANGGPYQLVAVTLNRLYSLLEQLAGDHTHDEDSTAPFLLSAAACGSRETGYRATREYLAGRLRLDDAMALSAAAFSPLATDNPLIIFLMTLFNARLGQWYPHPLHPPRWWPCALGLLGGRLSRDGPAKWCFLTDGGHYENLGLEQLLDRRCRLIVASDASADPESHFDDLLRVYRRARADQGIRVSRANLSDAGHLPTDGLRPRQGQGPVPLARDHYFVARIDYPEGFTGYLIYLKPSVTGDEPADLIGYCREHPEFPNDPTLNQFFDEDQFESYRQLGSHIGDQLCADLAGGPGPGPTTQLWDPGFVMEDRLESWLGPLSPGPHQGAARAPDC